MKDATQTLPASAGFAIMTPKHVARTNEPVLVSHIEFQCITGRQNSWAADEGDVVKVDNVKLALIQNAPNPAALNYGSSRLLGKQGRHSSQSASQPNDLDAVGFLCYFRFIALSQGIEGIYILQHRNVMPSAYQRLRETLRAHAVTPEVVRRIKRCHHAESEAAHESTPSESGIFGTRSRALQLLRPDRWRM